MTCLRCGKDIGYQINPYCKQCIPIVDKGIKRDMKYEVIKMIIGFTVLGGLIYVAMNPCLLLPCR